MDTNSHHLPRAALQLQAQGRQLARGQSVEFLFIHNGVHAWEMEEQPHPKHLDTKRYCTLLDRAMRTILDPCRPQLVPQKLLWD